MLENTKIVVFNTDSSTTVTLSFTDDAAATVNIDMLLDNVRVTGGGSGSPTTLQ